MKFTILGGTGFIGRHMAQYLRDQGHTVDIPARDTALLHGKNLGHVIYAIGLTGNFRQRPYDTVDAHVNVASQLLQKTTFDSFLYLSSTRVYGGLPSGVPANENSRLSLLPSADATYDLSKLLGESLCLAVDNPAVRVARLSNVYGTGQSEHTFLGAVLKEAQETGKVAIMDNPASSKDYIALSDVLKMLENIALHGKERIYNVASGIVTRNDDIGAALEAQGYQVTFDNSKSVRAFPPIDNTRITKEFNFTPRSLQRDIPTLLSKGT